MCASCRHSRENQYFVRVFLSYVRGGHVALCAKRKKNMSQFLLFKHCASSPKPPTTRLLLTITYGLPTTLKPPTNTSKPPTNPPQPPNTTSKPPATNLKAPTYLLTPWSRVLLEKLTGSAASQEIPRIFGTRRFLTVPTSARHLSVS